MSVSLSLYEGVVLVVFSLLSILAYWEIRHIHKIVDNVENRSLDIHKKSTDVLMKLDYSATAVQTTIMEYEPSLIQWKEMIDKNLEIPISEHLFHASWNTLVSLGASDMGKESTAKQNMALNGFQRIGKALGKGLKKEIPAISKLSGGGGGAGGDLLGGLASSMFGVDLPPGTMDLLLNSGSAKTTPAPLPAKTEPKKSSSDGFWEG